MLEKFFEILVRIAVALEKIAQPVGEDVIPVAQLTESQPPVDLDGLDAEGLPWDERIHSSNKKRTAKGVWVARKNLQPKYINQIKAELLAAQLAADETTVVAPPTPPAPPAASETVPPAPLVVEPPVPPPAIETAPPVAIDPPAPPMTAPPAELTFPAVIKAMTAAGHNAASITPFLVKYGLNALPALNTRPDLWLPVLTDMGLTV